MLLFKLTYQGKPADKKSFPKDLKVSDFLDHLCEISSIKLSELQLYVGYPPELLLIPSEAESLQDLGIQSGSVIALRTGATPSYSAAITTTLQSLQKLEIDRRQPLDLSSGKEWKCICCTFLNTSLSACCEMCESPKPILKMIRRVIDADNSCLYNCFGYLLLRSLCMSTRLREVCSKVAADESEKYNSAVLGREIDDYKVWVTKPDTWGGEVEISILSAYFNIGVGVVDIRTNQIYLYNCKYDNNEGSEERIYLLYDGIHYDALVKTVESNEQKSDNIDTDITIFSCTDFVAFDECKKIAADLKAATQYVDTSGFQLKCLVCGVGLVGQKDASEHAKSTGHQNFGQLEDK